MRNQHEENNVIAFISLLSDIVGITELQFIKVTDIDIRIVGTINQLADLLNALGTVPIKDHGQTKAMEYCHRLDAFIVRDKEYMAIAFSHPDYGYQALHVKGTDRAKEVSRK